jgi:short-subunit dehydrogenase
MQAGLVTVITGASSGIGRATARALAARRAVLILAARHGPPLEETAEECRALGAMSVLVRPLDVRDAEAVSGLARDAIERFGKIDVWINNAAQLAFGRFDVMPAEAFRLIIETNVLGMGNGARTAIGIFRTQGRGHLINIGSVLGRVSEPLVSAYAASKFAVEGMTRVMQQELRDEPHIRVSLALPWAIDTPIYRRAANFSGHAVRTIWPVYSPERAAAALCALIERPRHQTLIGAAAYAGTLALRVSRVTTLALAAWIGPKLQFEPTPDDESWGALRNESDAHAVSGGWRTYWRKRIASRLR